MGELTIKQAAERSKKIREHYRSLEVKHHGSKWSVEEDALAFLTDAGLVGRLTMAQQGRWPVGESNEADLEHKIGESIWWLMVLADRMGIDSEDALDNFLSTTEKRFDL
jgi:NTP pyrophosphatase (non-canonical NTP hydrolase)